MQGNTIGFKSCNRRLRTQDPYHQIKGYFASSPAAKIEHNAT